MNDKKDVDVYVARHAIFDRNLSLFGYELLFRPCAQNWCDEAGDSATLQVLANSLLSSGLQTISSNAPLFINFGRDLLTSHWASLFPPKSVVIEILESVDADAEVIASCLNLKKLGYMLALDDVISSKRDDGLTKLANIVKVDFGLTSKEEQVNIARRFKAAGKRLLAEKVETHAEFLWACQAGYDLFQGFFFARPTLLQGRHLPNTKLNSLRLINELQSKELNFQRLENLIHCDVSLTYKLFRYVNSALFSRQKQVCSVKDALMIMGELDVRRWMTLATLPGLASGRSGELIVHALVRARFCELLAGVAGQPNVDAAFLIGLFSLLDALIDRPLEDVLAELSLPDEIRRPLIDPLDPHPLARIFRASVAYQTADWSLLEKEIATVPIPPQQLADEYLEAVSWSSEMFSGIVCEMEPATKAKLGKAGETSWQSLMAMQAAVSKSGPAIETANAAARVSRRV